MRTVILRTAQVAIILGSVVIGGASMLATIPAEASSHHQPKPTPCWEGCHVEPSGAIGDPISGTNPKHHHQHKPPKEPRLTMPPTDTD